MKRILILVVMLVTCSIASFAQWTPNAPTTGDISFSGRNVGIGTTAPAGKLHVIGVGYFGNENSNASYRVSIGGSGTNYGSIGSGYKYGLSNFQHTYAVTDYASQIRFDLGGFNFLTAPVGTVGNPVTFTSAMNILQNGNVGIGTTAPYQALSLYRESNAELGIISNQSSSESILSFRINSTVRDGAITYRSDGRLSFSLDDSNGGYIQNNEYLTILPSGRVGIGNTAPLGKLDINSAGGQLRLSGGTVAGGVFTNAADLLFIGDWVSATKGMYINMTSGNIGIGTSNPNQKLTVNGTIYGKEIKVDLSVPGPDYVFEESYNLPSLTDTENYIKQNKHLPEVPSACEMEEKGINLSEMNMILLKKVEELTLYLIQQQTINAQQVKTNEELSSELKRLNDKIENLKK